jgi:hypothetical protein
MQSADESSDQAMQIVIFNNSQIRAEAYLKGAMPVAEMNPVCLTDPICNAGDAAAAGKGRRPKAAYEA